MGRGRVKRGARERDTETEKRERVFLVSERETLLAKSGQDGRKDGDLECGPRSRSRLNRVYVGDAMQAYLEGMQDVY